MPLYDCGVPDCEECQKAFGPDRSKAIANYHAREEYYERVFGKSQGVTHDEPDLDAHDIQKIDAAWEAHKAAAPSKTTGDA